MKKVSLLSLVILMFVTLVNAQTFQGTIKAGSTPNRVKAVIRPSGGSTTNAISNWQFTFAVPKSAGPQATASITNNPFSTGVSYTITVEQDATFYYYVLDGSGVASSPPTFTFTDGTEYDAVELSFQVPTSPAPTATVKMVQLPSGTFPTDFNTNFFISFTVAAGGNGGDFTNQGAQFYGSGAVNDGNGYSGNSSVSLGGVSLPTKFVSFLAAKEKNDAQLTWTVDNEQQNDHFDLEKSTDGRTFTKFATVPAAKNGHSSNSYNLTDYNFSRAENKVVYYRVKQYEYSGASEYSQVRNLQLEAKDFKLSLFPNPATSQTRFIFNIEQPGKGAIVVRDLHGREVQVINQVWVKGLNQQTINVQGLAAGEYNVSLVGENINQTIQLRKVN